MIKRDDYLSPRERVEAALKLHELESPGTPVSIAAICAKASVSRANLYARHGDLIKRIQRPDKAATRKRGTVPSTVDQLKQELAAERKKSLALYYCCVELQAQVHLLRARAARPAFVPGRPSRSKSADRTNSR